MKSTLYMLMIGLLVLAGCNNQSLESSKQSVSKTHQVKINLGDDLSSRSNRYKGNYQDVIDGGSVVLHYSFPSDNTTVELEAEMSQSAVGDWTVDLTLATGTYTFWANAYDKDDVRVFETDTPRTYSINVSTSSLNLGLQLNPILEDVSGTPMPIITQLSKPSGYFPGTPMKVGFTVKGGHDDLLQFFMDATIPAPDNTSNSKEVGNYFTSVDLSPSISDNISTYQDWIEVDIPADATGPLTVIFGVGSDTLQSGSYLEFTVNQAVEVSGGDNNTLVFVPTVDEFWLGTNADDDNSSSNSLSYYFEVSGNQDFYDNVSFQFEGSSTGYDATVAPGYSGEPDERFGTLYRSVMDPGTLTITFTSYDGQYSHSYDYHVPGGPATNVSTYIPSPPSQNYAIPSHNTIDGVTLQEGSSEWISDNFTYWGETKSYDLEIRYGTALYMRFMDDSIPVHVSIQEDNSGTIVRSETFDPGNGSGIYLPAGFYTVEATSDNATGQYSVEVWYEDTHVIKIGNESFPTEWEPVSVDGSWADNTTKEYDVYIGHGTDWRLTFTQANSRNLVGSPEGNMLHFCLMDDRGSYWNCGSDWWGDFSLSSTNTYAPSPGWYTLKVRSNGSWSGTWAAYATSTNVDFGNSIQTPDNLVFDLATGDKFFRLSQSNVYNYQSYFVQTDCSKDIVIEEDEGSLYDVYDEFGYWVDSYETDSDGNRRITTNDCDELLELEFSPSAESRIKFGIQLDNGTASLSPVTGLTAYSYYSGSVDLNWDHWDHSNGVDNYTVYWTSNTGVSIDPNYSYTYDNFTTVAAPTTSATATGLTTGVSYNFIVIATRHLGSSPPSNVANATPW